MKNSNDDHVLSMMDSFTEGVFIPTNLSDAERRQKLQDHVVTRCGANGIGLQRATALFKRWFDQLRAANRLCNTPGCEPEQEPGARPARYLIDGRTNMVCSTV